LTSRQQQGDQWRLRSDPGAGRRRAVDGDISPRDVALWKLTAKVLRKTYACNQLILADSGWAAWILSKSKMLSKLAQQDAAS